MALATLGLFVFELKTAPFSTLSRDTGQRWQTQNRVGKPPAAQWTGPGDDALTIEGALMPELTGGRAATLDVLRDMAARGKAWSLIDGLGRNQGRWYIDKVTEKAEGLTLTGQPRKIDFTIALNRYWDNDPDAFGDLQESQG